MSHIYDADGTFIIQAEGKKKSSTQCHVIEGCSKDFTPFIMRCARILELDTREFVIVPSHSHKRVSWFEFSMGQQTLIYSFVSRGQTILTEFTENFTTIASQCLQKIPSNTNKFLYNQDGHIFNYLIDNAFTYYVVSVESAGRQLPLAFLERAKDDFNKRYGGEKAATAVANSLNKEFGPKLKEHMHYCVVHSEEISKLSKVKAQVTEVKGVMMENIKKVLDRGEKIVLLVDKTDTLRDQADEFRTRNQDEEENGAPIIFSCNFCLKSSLEMKKDF